MTDTLVNAPAAPCPDGRADDEFVLHSELCNRLRTLGEINDEDLLIEAANAINELYRRLVELDAAPPLDEQPAKARRRLRALFDLGVRIRVTRGAVVLRLSWQR